MINNKRIARRYAKVFLHEKAEKEKISILADELQALVNASAADEEINKFFTSPIIEKEVKLKVVNNIVKRLELSSYTLAFLELLIKKDRINIIASIAEEIHEIADQVNGRVRVTVTTAIEPSVEDIEDLSRKIGKFFKSNTVVQREIDKSIIGGFIIEGEGKLIDMSVKGQIRRILTKM